MQDETSNASKQTKSEPNLYKKTVKGGAWVFGLRISMQLLAFLRLIILARILLPSDFGMLAIAMITISVINRFTETGMPLALVQKKGDITKYLNTVWTTQIIRSAILCTVLVLAAPYIVSFFEPSGALKPSDITKPIALAKHIRDENTPLATYIRTNLSESTLKELENLEIDSLSPQDLKANLANDINILLEKDDFYSPARFDQADFNTYAKEILDNHTENTDFSVLRINRLALEQSFDNEISPVIINKPMAAMIIKIMAVLMIIGAIRNIGVIYFTRDLEFHKKFILHLSKFIVDMTVTITLAIIYKSLWAIVAGKIASVLVDLVMSYTLHPYRPGLGFNKAHFKELWGFGKWIYGSSILAFLIDEGDDIFVGKMLGTSSLGSYRMAFRISNIPATEITQVIGSITFPAYAKIQDDRPRLADAYMKVLKITAFTTIPIGGMIFALAPEFVGIFMKPQWLAMVTAMQILAIWGTVRSIGTSVASAFKPIGKPKIIAKILALKLILLAILIYPLTIKWGITGTALATVINPIIVLPLSAYIAHKMLRFSLLQFLKSILLPLVATFAAAMTVYQTKAMLLDRSAPLCFNVSNVLGFAVCAFAGIAIYIIVSAVFDRLFNYGIKEIIAEQFRTFKKQG